MGMVSFGSLANKVRELPAALKQFLLSPTGSDLADKVRDLSNAATYDTNIWASQQNMQTLAMLREVPQMLKDGVIASCVELIMETAFQTNDKQEVLWVTSPYSKVTDLLTKFHEDVNMQKQVLTMGNNLLLWGNLPYRHYFNSNNEFVNFTPIPDFTAITPLILSGKTLGFLVNGQFHYPYEFTYAQLEYFKNLGGIYQNNLIQLTGMTDGLADEFGAEFRNEFSLAPSYLSRAVRPWKNINIIEDALLLHRMDQSNYYRIIAVGVGGSVTSKSAIRTLNYYNNLIKKVRRVSYDPGGMVSRGTSQNFELVVPETQAQKISVTDVGGNTEGVRALKDLEMMYNKLFASLRVQPSQIGFGEENTNAIGESNGASYDKRFARTCKTLIYSVFSAVRNFDYLYLRSRGYDVSFNDWQYRNVSLSVLEDADRVEVIAKAIENTKSLAEVLASGVALENYNKSYLVESLLGPPLSAIGVDIKRLLEVPEAVDDLGGDDMAGDMGGGEAGAPPLLGSSYQSTYIGEILDVMESSHTVGSEFIGAARASLADMVPSTNKLITSGRSLTDSRPIPFRQLDDVSPAVPLDTLVDISNEVRVSPQSSDAMGSILSSMKPNKVWQVASISYSSPVIVPSDMKVTLGDMLSSGIHSLGRVYGNRAGELFLTNKDDLVTYLNMKSSGGLDCIASELVYLDV